MASFIALLRGINVGGNNLVSMAKLRELAIGLGLLEARTWLQSGNLVFEAGGQATNAIERLLENETQVLFGIPVTYVVRTGAEWADTVASNPFADAASDDPSHLVVNFLKEAPDVDGLAQIDSYCRVGEQTQLVGQALFVAYPNGIGTSKLTNAVIERALKTKCTARNWNTVLKLAEMVRS